MPQSLRAQHPGEVPERAPKGLEARLEKALQGPSGAFQLSLSLQLQEDEWLALLGPSGAGKSTLIRLLAGLEHADHGHIQAFGECWLDSARRHCLPTRRRRVGLMFQDYALFPHMSVRGNLRFALPRGRPAAQADEWLERMGLGGLAERLPAGLSGGQQQRLALARTLATEPRLLLLDEPLSALDGELRRDLQDSLLAWRGRGLGSLILVTHDPAEAARLCDRALHLRGGRLIAPEPAVGEPSLMGTLLARQADGRWAVDVQGRTCQVELQGQGQPGERVRLSARQWFAHPMDP